MKLFSIFFDALVGAILFPLGIFLLGVVSDLVFGLGGSMVGMSGMMLLLIFTGTPSIVGAVIGVVVGAVVRVYRADNW